MVKDDEVAVPKNNYTLLAVGSQARVLGNNTVLSSSMWQVER
jgi:hypothetical protein